MSSFTKIPLSGSTNGRGVKVVQTATAGTTIHTAGASGTDEVWIYVTNDHSDAVDVTFEWGGVTDPDDLIQFNLAAKTGLTLVAPGLIIENSLIVKCFASVANVIVVFGYVNRIS